MSKYDALKKRSEGLKKQISKTAKQRNAFESMYIDKKEEVEELKLEIARLKSKIETMQITIFCLEHRG